jgi:adenylyl-sulfate kinase
VKYAFFIGRWQPFHNGHDYIIRQALNAGKCVLIGVRNTPITCADPYTAEQRVEMIRRHFRHETYTGAVDVIVIPDIESVNIGRKVGYEVIRYDAPEDVEGISATAIRDMLVCGDATWRTKVPKAVADYLDPPVGEVVWLTGLSGAGKSTIAQGMGQRLTLMNVGHKILDGDEVRQNLTRGLGFSKEDRDENIRRVAFVAKSVADAGGVAIVACISPYAEARDAARDLIGAERFTEVYVKCSLEVLKQRDTKGLYAKAIAGEIANFTGISDPYETPKFPALIVSTHSTTTPRSVEMVLDVMKTRTAR